MYVKLVDKNLKKLYYTKEPLGKGYQSTVTSPWFRRDYLGGTFKMYAIIENGNKQYKVAVGDTVKFKEGATFTGHLKTIRICIEMGADFSGSCQIINEAEFKSLSAEFFH